MKITANPNTSPNTVKGTNCNTLEQEKFLVKISDNQNKHYDISAFIRETNHITGNNENHFSMLVSVMKKCQRVVALGNLENVPLEKSEVTYLLYQLFELETKFEKVEIIDLVESE